MMVTKASYQQDLQLLLEESLDAAGLRAQKTFIDFAGSFEDRLVLFGMGGLGRRTLKGLRSLGIEPIALTDNNPNIWNTIVEGRSVMSPQDAVTMYGDSSVFVLTIWNHILGHPLVEVSRQLNSYGAARVISFAHLYWRHPQLFLPFFCLDHPSLALKQAEKVLDCFYLWNDEASRHEYLAQVRLRLWLDFQDLPRPVSGRQYFPADIFTLIPEEVFVDCGAFDGDTLKDFLAESGGVFLKFLAFEPDQRNFTELQEFVSGLSLERSENIVTKPFAVGECNANLRFAANGCLQSAVSRSGAEVVECVKLDDILDIPPTYIKMDVEGAEPEVIKGASDVIRRYSPILAISVYHRPDHLWLLPLLVRSLSDRYEFFLRPHRRDGWDLVCYAVPRERTSSVHFIPELK